LGAAEPIVAGTIRSKAVRARHAASLILLRERPDGPEVLMGTRGARHRFMPNRLVFPGGTVDRSDFAAPCLAPLSPETRQQLERSANPRLAQALAHAAARELEEETGLTLGRPPDLGGVHYLCRAVTPEHYPIRFNARFLVSDASLIAGRLAGSGELERLRWYRLEEARAMDLAEITREILDQLETWLSMSEAQRRDRSMLVRRSRAWRNE
jgi:8-oxo-dGTP pyrophosphatase MutT (NUDIX family)